MQPIMTEGGFVQCHHLPRANAYCAPRQIVFVNVLMDCGHRLRTIICSICAGQRLNRREAVEGSVPASGFRGRPAASGHPPLSDTATEGSANRLGYLLIFCKGSASAHRNPQLAIVRRPDANVFGTARETMRCLRCWIAPCDREGFFPKPGRDSAYGDRSQRCSDSSRG
jgi:hypothetical protein